MQKHSRIASRIASIGAALLVATVALAPAAHATGLATCDSGDPSKWQSQDTLSKQLVEKGWQIRRIKIDGGCYEVYALNEKGERVEAYFHPVTLAPVPTTPRRQGGA